MSNRAAGRTVFAIIVIVAIVYAVLHWELTK